MTPATVTATGRNGNLPPRPDPAATVSLNNIDFEIKGQLDSTAIQMEHALTGQSNNLQYCICPPKDSVAVKTKICSSIGLPFP